MKVKPEWLSRFRQEAHDHLTEIHRLMNELVWERNPTRPGSPEAETAQNQQLRQLFVRVHGLKGTASMIGLSEVAAAAFELERLWGEVLLEPTRLSETVQAQAIALTARLSELVAVVPE